MLSFQDQVSGLMKNYKLELDESRRDVILVIGRTGVGKSTLARILFGDVEALESTFDSDLLVYKIKNTKEGLGSKESSMFHSDTICPQLFTDPTNPDLAIYDCPGFADTRGTSNEIATGVYLSQIIEHAKRVKLVVTVDYDSVKPNADRTKFTDGVLPEVLDFVLNNDIYDGGVHLIVTKYSNPNEGPYKKFSDDEIVASIVEFLKGAQDCALEKWRDQRGAINALFRKSLLLQTRDGKYTNIGFTRTITSEGNLSNMESTTRRAQLYAQLLDNTNFNFRTSDPKSFGYPISPAAKLEIRKVLGDLVGDAEVLLKTVSQKVVNKFVSSLTSPQQLSTFVDHYVPFLNALDQLTEEKSGLSPEGLEVLRTLGSNIRADIEDEAKELYEMAKRVKYLSGVDIEQSSTVLKDADGKWNETVLRIFQDIVNESRRAQRDLATQVDQQLKSVVQRVIIKYIQSPGKDFLHCFHQFLYKVKSLDKSGLTMECIEILRNFGRSIGDDMREETEKLAGITCSLESLAKIDEQSALTWSDVDLKWNHAIESMETTIAELKAQRDLAEAKAQGELAVAQAQLDLVAAQAQGEVAAARAEAELVAAKAEAARVEAEAQNKLMAAKAERDLAALAAQAELAAANLRAQNAETDREAASSSRQWEVAGRVAESVFHMAPLILKYYLRAAR